MPTSLFTYWKAYKIPALLTLLGLVLYYTLAYHLERTDFIKLVTLFGVLFFPYYGLIRIKKWDFRFLLVVGLLFRLVFLIAEPNLSQDFYRFIWDGGLVCNFINPYLGTPDILITNQGSVIPNAEILHKGMGELSARHFSSYPPLNQLVFALTTWLGGKSILGSIIAMRTIIIVSDIGIFHFGRKLLKNLNLSPHLIFWYFLNPLIIVELTGNLHFEGVMLLFFVASLYLLSIGKWMLAAVVYALSIAIKLIPLMFLPLFLKHFGFKKSFRFYIVAVVTLIAISIPFISPGFIANYSQTVGLWFSNFKFNSSLYNLVREIAVQFDAKPWELIKTYGKITPYITISIIVLVTFFRKNQNLSVLISSMLYILTTYYLLATIVHPWYIIFLVLLTIFTEYRFPLAWSLVVILSYYAYSQIDFKEHLGILSIEYIIVYGFLIFELFRHHGQKPLFHKN
ncbi:MAG: mannosyltransferase [Maribacter sp.]|nr:MAG: mannosyltransferase [Maribacter sp.]